MVNQSRGEISVELDGRQWTLCLTLGSLSELEAHFRVNDISGLASILSSGNISSKDIMAIIAAGLKGGGYTLSIEDVSEMRHKDGPAGYAKITADLLSASFGVASENTANAQ